MRAMRASSFGSRWSASLVTDIRAPYTTPAGATVTGVCQAEHRREVRGASGDGDPSRAGHADAVVLLVGDRSTAVSGVAVGGGVEAADAAARPAVGQGGAQEAGLALGGDHARRALVANGVRALA